jgi:hypothetical protein
VRIIELAYPSTKTIELLLTSQTIKTLMLTGTDMSDISADTQLGNNLKSSIDIRNTRHIPEGIIKQIQAQKGFGQMPLMFGSSDSNGRPCNA